MYPLLFRLGDFSLHTYGVLLAAAFLLAIWVALREARRQGMDTNQVMDLFFYILIAALIGSRVFYVLTSWHEFRDHPIDVVRFWKGGLVFYGGFLCAVVVGTYYVWKHNLNFPQLADLVAPSVALGQAIGRLGCFSAGCCFGKPTDLPWACVFTSPDSLAPLGIPLHPTQLYESAATFVIFLALLRMRRREKFQGKLIWYYVLFYAGVRFFLEFLRADPRGFLIPEALSTSQAIAIPLSILAIAMIWRKKD
jgi:phosphatidylglycerol:prolipoprotein diacylglycerol transferase